MASAVSEIPLLSKTAKFPFQTMDYSPWSSKNSMDRNRLKIFMQVGIDVTCMYIDFLVGVASLISEIPPLSKTAKFPFQTMDYSPRSSKNSMDRNRLKIFMQVGIDVTCMYIDFLVGVASLISEIPPLSKTAKFPFLTMDYSPWSSKNSIDRNWLKKFMQVGIDVKCMHTNFGGWNLSGFGDTATFKNGQISLSDHGL